MSIVKNLGAKRRNGHIRRGDDLGHHVKWNATILGIGIFTQIVKVGILPLFELDHLDLVEQGRVEVEFNVDGDIVDNITQ